VERESKEAYEGEDGAKTFVNGCDEWDCDSENKSHATETISFVDELLKKFDDYENNLEVILEVAKRRPC
jgi:hypothetical protein